MMQKTNVNLKNYEEQEYFELIEPNRKSVIKF